MPFSTLLGELALRQVEDLGPDDVERFVGAFVLGGRAAIEIAGVIEGRDRGGNRIGEAPLFPDFAKQARGEAGAAAQHMGEHDEAM